MCACLQVHVNAGHPSNALPPQPCIYSNYCWPKAAIKLLCTHPIQLILISGWAGSSQEGPRYWRWRQAPNLQCRLQGSSEADL